MTTNLSKSSTGVNIGDLACIFEVISKMPGSTQGDVAPPSGGATIPLTDQTSSRILTPNPDMGKSTIDSTVDPEVNLEGVDPGNTTRRSRRLRVNPKTPRTVARNSTLGSPPSGSALPWYPPHFYPPWFPSPYQHPYATPSARYLPQSNPQTTSRPSASKQPTRFRSRTTETQQEYPEDGRPVQPGEERTKRNLLPDFEQARSENTERTHGPGWRRRRGRRWR